MSSGPSIGAGDMPVLTEEHLQRANALHTEIKIKAKTYELASVAFNTKYRQQLYLAILLGVAGVGINVVWPGKEAAECANDQCKEMMIALTACFALNAVVTALSALTRFDALSSACAHASTQFEDIAQRISFATQLNSSGLDATVLNDLIADSLDRELTLKLNTVCLSLSDEAKHRAAAVQAIKNSGANLGSTAMRMEQLEVNSEQATLSKVLPAFQSKNATRHDFGRLEALRITLKERKKRLSNVHLYYHAKYYNVSIPSIAICAASAALSSSWPHSTKMYRSIMLLAGLVNVVLLAVLYMTPYRQLYTTAEAVTCQYNVLLTKVMFAGHYRIGLEHEYVADLVSKSTKADQQIQDGLSPEIKKHM
jgi:hypothetical protein